MVHIALRDRMAVGTSAEVRHVPASRDESAGAHDGQDRTSHIDPTLRHRLEFARFASEDGHEPYRERLRDIYHAWRGWNRDFFEGELNPPHFLLAEPKNPRALGDHSIFSGWGSTNQIRIRPSILDGRHPCVRPGEEFAEGRFLLTLDIALHEAGHQFATEVLGRREESYRGHGPVFRDLCNRIGNLLGLPAVRAGKARGRDRDLPSCAEWPICVRPEGYYLGAYLPHEEHGLADEPGDPAAPVPPKALADWLAANPEWAERFCRFGEGIFTLLDRFFDAHPAPSGVREQAVSFLAKSYRHRRRTEPAMRTALPAPSDA